ncbi:MAG: peptide deformylase [Patescibacteria group bacterium]|nr:peptide deformylase [Patescibacteria group bacterium]
MSPAYEVLTYKNASVRERSLEVDAGEITTKEFQDYLDKLIITMHAEDGIGIASPQVGINKRVFIAHIKHQDIAFINPKIVKTSEATVETEEGCLSVPHVYGIVTRPKRVTITALDRHGRKMEFDLKNTEAVIVQHENDHLDGVLFVDKMTEVTKGTYPITN